jgi:hypothetical protein
MYTLLPNPSRELWSKEALEPYRAAKITQQSLNGISEDALYSMAYYYVLAYIEESEGRLPGFFLRAYVYECLLLSYAAHRFKEYPFKEPPPAQEMLTARVYKDYPGIGSLDTYTVLSLVWDIMNETGIVAEMFPLKPGVVV